MWITVGSYLSVSYFITMDENIIYDSESYGTFFDDTTSKTSLLNERYVLNEKTFYKKTYLYLEKNWYCLVDFIVRIFSLI